MRTNRVQEGSVHVRRRTSTDTTRALAMGLALLLLGTSCQGIGPGSAGDTPDPTPAAVPEVTPEAESTGSRDTLGAGTLAFDGRLEPDAPFDQPYGIDVDADGRVYVLDAGNDRVVVFGPDGGQADEWGVGDLTTMGFGGLAVADDGRVYVVDNGNHRVQVFDPDGTPAQAFGEEGDGLGTFERAIGIAVYDGEVFVTDDEVPFVQVFDSGGTFLRQFGGPGEDPGGFLHATGIAVDASGVYVADFEAARIQRFSIDGDVDGEWRNPGPAGTFEVPEGIAIDQDGTVLVTGYRSGNLSLLPTEPGEDAWTLAEADDGSQDGSLRSPADVAIGPDGTVYVADQGGNAVLRFVRSG